MWVSLYKSLNKLISIFINVRQFGYDVTRVLERNATKISILQCKETVNKVYNRWEKVKSAYYTFNKLSVRKHSKQTDKKQKEKKIEKRSQSD